MIAGVLPAVAGYREVRPSARRRRNKIPRTRGHQLGHLAARQQRWDSRILRRQRDLREMLDRLHAEKRGQQIRSARYRAMIRQQQSVVVRHEWLQRGAQLGRSRRSILHQRNLAEPDNHFGKQRLIQRASRHGETRCGRWMRVTNRVHVGPHAIEQKMHCQFGRRFAVPRNLPPFEVDGDQIFGRQHAFVHARRRGQNSDVVQPDGEVALASDVKPAFIHPAPNHAEIGAMLLLGFVLAGGNNTV